MSKTRLALPCLEIRQPVGLFYGCVIPAQSLLEICRFDFRRIEENDGVKEFLGIQRKLSKPRVKEIRQYIATQDASFPTSIVINVDQRCASVETIDGREHLVLKSYMDPENEKNVIAFREIATIIDGQHRLKAFEGTDFNWDLSVNVIIGADPGTQAMLFSKVNLAQTKVNKSLVYDLFSLDKGRSPEKTAHEIAVNLNEMEESPLFERIKRLGTATDGVFGETLSQATVVRGYLPYISKDPMMDRDIGRRSGVFPERGQKDFERRIFYPAFAANRDEEILLTILHYFQAIQQRWPEAWDNTGTGAMLSRTNGYNAFIRFLKDAYLHVTSKPRVIKREEFSKLLEKVPLTDADFNTDRYQPGSGGASSLYADLAETID